ncbi:hypothetical protein PMSD_01205 [Paenibacillus macquariensis subsp. defensor]|nr:hypothetical protein PMSD_01205 [Paenibacillus macquariensis subsp. defensor]
MLTLMLVRSKSFSFILRKVTLYRSMNKLKQQHEALTRRRQEALRQLERSSADLVPLHQVREVLSQFHKLLSKHRLKHKRTCFRSS